MALLISFCNERWTPEKTLLALDPADPFSASWVSWPLLAAGRHSGVTGIARLGTRTYAITQDQPSRLLAFDHGLRFLWSAALDEVLDAHSLEPVGSSLYAVSTGSNALVRVDLRADGEGVAGAQVVWAHEDRRVDRDLVHLNSVTHAGDDIIVTCFGEKQDDSWSATRNGRCMNLTRGTIVSTGIPHPHSACVIADRLYVCGSADGTLRRSERGRFDRLAEIAVLGGYLRGLAAHGDHLYVGRSAARQVSKSTGKANRSGREGAPGCALLILDQDMRLVREISLAAFGEEIYEIRSIEGVTPAGGALDERARAFTARLERARTDGEAACAQLRAEVARLVAELNGLRSSRAYRLGAGIAWPWRMARAGWRSIRTGTAAGRRAAPRG
jgi:hypothetical protein